MQIGTDLGIDIDVDIHAGLPVLKQVRCRYVHRQVCLCSDICNLTDYLGVSILMGG